MCIAAEKRKRISDEDEVMHTHTHTLIQRLVLAEINFPQKANVWAIVPARQQQQQKRNGIEFGDLERYTNMHNHHRCPIEKVLKLFSL